MSRKDFFRRDEKYNDNLYGIRPEINYNPFIKRAGFPPGGLNFDKIKAFEFEDIPKPKEPFSRIENIKKEVFVKDVKIKTPKVLQTFTVKPTTKRKIIGKILDETGQPMPSVTVSVVGNTANGTSTDFNGNYTIYLEKDNTIQVRFLGYTTKVYPGNKIPKVVKMNTDSNVLDEVKLPDVKKKNKNILYAGLGLGVLGLAFLASRKDAGKSNVVKRKRKKATKKAGLKAANITL